MESHVRVEPYGLMESVPSAFVGRKVVPRDLPPERVTQLPRRLPPCRSQSPFDHVAMTQRGYGEKVQGVPPTRGRDERQSQL
uniref:Uncharacterized protein n=1 Tax=Peronospora matthiolae TaxID=2874970 RepID=A0AAV1V4C0_9STRA